MKRLTVLLILSLIGCGGSAEKPLNHTKHTDSYLNERWAAAQAQIAAEIHLDPTEHHLHGAPLRIPAGDRRAFRVYPRQITVQSVPDLPSNA